MSDGTSSFRDFITQNGIISTTAGITIGFATASFVKSFVADIIMPIIFLILVKATGKVSSTTSGFFAKFLSNKEFLFTNFVSELITWVVIVLTAWLVLDLVYRYVIMQDKIKLPVIANPFAIKEEQKREGFAEPAGPAPIEHMQHGKQAPVKQAWEMTY